MSKTKEPIDIEHVTELCKEAEVVLMATSNGIYVNGDGASILACLNMLVSDLIESGIPRSAVQLTLLMTLDELHDDKEDKDE